MNESACPPIWNGSELVLYRCRCSAWTPRRPTGSGRGRWRAATRGVERGERARRGPGLRVGVDGRTQGVEGGSGDGLLVATPGRGQFRTRGAMGATPVPADRAGAPRGPGPTCSCRAVLGAGRPARDGGPVTLTSFEPPRRKPGVNSKTAAPRVRGRPSSGAVRSMSIRVSSVGGSGTRVHARVRPVVAPLAVDVPAGGKCEKAKSEEAQMNTDEHRSEKTEC